MEKEVLCISRSIISARKNKVVFIGKNKKYSLIYRTKAIPFVF